MIEPDEWIARAGARMQARRWKAKLANRRGYDQDLFGHSLIEVDVLLALLPILSDVRHYGLSEAEQRILAVAVLVHDVGKETDAWQRCVRSAAAVPYVLQSVLPNPSTGTIARAQSPAIA